MANSWQCLVIRDPNNDQDKSDSGKKGVSSIPARILLLSLLLLSAHQLLGTSLI